MTISTHAAKGWGCGGLRLARRAALGVLLLAAPALARPALFADLLFEDAKARAQETGKLLIVDATAEWCGPCKVMDRTTWVDEGVVAWVGEKAVAIQLDVDEHAATARALHIMAMPTVIVFKDGKEFDRVVGLKQAPELLAWLEGVEAGRSALEALRERAGERAGPDKKVDIDARYELAESLVEARKFDEATEEYLWLWHNMLEHDPGYHGVRLSFMTGAMGELAEMHEPAMKAFAALRDSIEAKLKGDDATMLNLSEWIELNNVVGDDDRTVAWYDRVRDDPGAAESIARSSLRLQPLLIERGRLADVAWLVNDPVAEVRRDIAMHKMSRQQRHEFHDMTAEDRAELEALELTWFRDETATMYAACLAGGRETPAEEIARLLLEVDNTAPARFALIECAIGAGQARERHLLWLDESDAMGDRNAHLRERVERALAGGE